MCKGSSRNFYVITLHRKNYVFIFTELKSACEITNRRVFIHTTIVKLICEFP